jgi:hypothetical protein
MHGWWDRVDGEKPGKGRVPSIEEVETRPGLVSKFFAPPQRLVTSKLPHANVFRLKRLQPSML